MALVGSAGREEGNANGRARWMALLHPVGDPLPRGARARVRARSSDVAPRSHPRRTDPGSAPAGREMTPERSGVILRSTGWSAGAPRSRELNGVHGRGSGGITGTDPGACRTPSGPFFLM